MKALSIRQPFAHEIMCGRKTIEVRSRRTNYRGDLLICASLNSYVGDIVHNSKIYSTIDYLKYLVINSENPLYGKAVCIVNLYDCTEFTPNLQDQSKYPFSEGLYAWHFSNVRHIDPFEVKGKLGLFHVDFEAGIEQMLSPIEWSAECGECSADWNGMKIRVIKYHDGEWGFILTYMNSYHEPYGYDTQDYPLIKQRAEIFARIQYARAMIARDVMELTSKIKALYSIPDPVMKITGKLSQINN